LLDNFVILLKTKQVRIRNFKDLQQNFILKFKELLMLKSVLFSLKKISVTFYLEMLLAQEQ